MKKFILAGVLLILTALAFVILRTSPHTYYLDYFKIQVMSAQANADGSLRVTLLLTNGTEVPLNVVDDPWGKPAIFVKPDVGDLRLVTDRANMVTINVAPRTCLTNSIILTNPPLRFQLACSLRNLGAERRVWLAYRILPRSTAKRFVEWRRRDYDLPLRCTDWIDLATITNGSPSTP